MKPRLTIAIVCAVVILVAGLLWTTGRPALKTVTYSQFLNQIQMGQVTSVVIVGSNSGAAQATCRLKDGNTVRTVLPSDYRDVLAAMQSKMVNVEIRDSSGPLRYFANATPFFLLLSVWIILMIRRTPNGFRVR